MLTTVAELEAALSRSGVGERLPHVRKRIAIYGTHVADKMGCDDAAECPETHVRAVLDVLKHAYKIVDVAPSLVCELLDLTGRWYWDNALADHEINGNDAINSMNARHVCALTSAPQLLPHCVDDIECNEWNVPRVPYPIIGNYGFTEDEVREAAVRACARSET